MIYEHCRSLTFFTWWVPLQVVPFKHIRFHNVHLLTLSTTKASVNILILLFYICPSQVHPGIQIHPICNSFLDTGYKFFMFYIVLIFYRVLTRILKFGVKYCPPEKSWSFTILIYWDFPKSWSQKWKVGVTYSKSGVNEISVLHRQLIRISIRHFEYSSSNLVTT